MNPGTLEDLLDRYVSLWNEPDAQRRRERIPQVWAPGAASLHRLLEPRGHAALEQRIAASHEKWNGGRGYRFRSARHAFGHHATVMFNWEMIDPAAADRVVAHGLSFMLLDRDGLIDTELQFAEPQALATQDAHQSLVDRYVAVWNEADAARRRDRIADLWHADGCHVNPDAAFQGHGPIDGEVTHVYAQCGARGLRFRCAGHVDGHHDAVRMDWALTPADDASHVMAAGTNLLLLGGDGRLRRDVQFNTPARRAG